MAGKLRTLAIIPMGGGHKEPDGDEEMNKEPEAAESEDGLRESFDEFADAAGIADESRDAAFEALRGMIEQCCAKEY